MILDSFMVEVMLFIIGNLWWIDRLVVRLVMFV